MAMYPKTQVPCEVRPLRRFAFSPCSAPIGSKTADALAAMDLPSLPVRLIAVDSFDYQNLGISPYAIRPMHPIWRVLDGLATGRT